ncbi:MAG: hypothetical protein EB829_04950 [Nitrosopumilus sp. H8]|nr:MAG: hypothetical protein EB829_04950 [Nitrosopumilus sp. H8]
MVDLFVDIETVPDFTAEEYQRAKQETESGSLTRDSDRGRFWKFQIGSLTPFEGRIILITYRINNAHVFRLKEWEDGEKEMLEKFYKTVMELQRGEGDKLRIIGHNILGFDMAFLYNRMIRHKIAEDKWIHHWMLRKPLILDLLQMHMPLNSYYSKGLKHDVLAHAYGLPTKDTSGGDEAQHYFAGDYDKILEYSEREFIYPEMFARMESGGMVSSGKLQESIDHYNSIHEDSIR